MITHVDGSSTANAVMVSGGTIWLAGSDSDDKDAVLASYSTHGVLLTMTATAIESGEQAGWNAIMISGSNILVAGYAQTSSGPQYIAVGEYNASGSLVSTFGSGGITLTADGNNSAVGNAILVSGSSVWVAGGANGTAVLVQYNSAGAFDQIVVSALSGNSQWNAIASAGGNILVAGESNGTMALAEYNTYGYLATSTFGSNGMVMTSVGSSSGANAIDVESSGKILVTGYGTYLSSQELALVQYTSSGSLDPTFGVGGIALPMSVAGVPSTGCAVATLSNGTIVAAGQLKDSNSNYDMFLSEYTVDSTSLTTYTYDVRNKMVGFSGATGTATYLYDDDGNRVQETTGGTTSFYLTDTANPTGYAQPIEVWTSTNGSLSSATLNTTYVIGDRVFGQDVSGTVSYLLVDGHGSTRLITNGTATLLNVLNYDAFGDALDFNPAAPPTLFLFGGDAVFDPVSGLYMHGDGVRDTEGFLFIQMDSYAGNKQDPITLHKYLYANADPVNGWDPSGQEETNYAFDEIADVDSDNLGALGTIGSSIGNLFGGYVLSDSVLGAAAVGAIWLSGPRAPEVVAAGLLGGLCNFIISAMGDGIREVQGKTVLGGPPCEAKYVNAAIQGFTTGAVTEALPVESIIPSAIVGGIVASAGDIISEILGGQPIDWKGAATDFVVGAILGAMLNPVTSSVIASKSTKEMAPEVAKHIASISSAAALTEIGLLIQTWLP